MAQFLIEIFENIDNLGIGNSVLQFGTTLVKISPHYNNEVGRRRGEVAKRGPGRAAPSLTPCISLGSGSFNLVLGKIGDD